MKLKIVSLFVVLSLSVTVVFALFSNNSVNQTYPPQQ
jgi:hypothetical protein